MKQNPSPLVTIAMAGPRPTQPLVYVLWRRGIPVYVGYSRCLRERIAMHKGTRIKADRVTYACYDCEWQAKAAEQMLIRLLQPKHNKSLYRSAQQYGKLVISL